MSHWYEEAVVYHVYPLGALGAEKRNPGTGEVVPRLAELETWIPHWQSLGINTLLIGPVFESQSHGYDTRDYFAVDRRLGDAATLKSLVAKCREAGIRVVLDAVFNHVGREHPFFLDVKQHRQASAYAAWFAGLDFSQPGPRGDGFAYEGWAGHLELVKWDTSHREVRRYLLEVLEFWRTEFGIDGVRLDAADVLAPVFLEDLRSYSRQRGDDFWLMGEVVHGDYRNWVGPTRLHAVTNYEVYKGLWSSHFDRNFFEIDYSLKRQFAPGGVYEGAPLFHFADNHDVNRVASSVREPAQLFSLYGLLFTLPGVPSVYYGSEGGRLGTRTPHDDSLLRPRLEKEDLTQGEAPDLPQALARLTRVRAASRALRKGTYRPLHVGPETLVFAREAPGETLVVVVQGGAPGSELIRFPADLSGTYHDILNGGEWRVEDGAQSISGFPHWVRIFRRCA